LIGKIEFKGYTFKYTGSSTAVISNLNLTINDGETVALIGKSGIIIIIIIIIIMIIII
jgi:ABC-type bacteriocin/lantibiotic exporter with double-glycine peptidase domain